MMRNRLLFFCKNNHGGLDISLPSGADLPGERCPRNQTRRTFCISLRTVCSRIHQKQFNKHIPLHSQIMGINKMFPKTARRRIHQGSNAALKTSCSSPRVKTIPQKKKDTLLQRVSFFCQATEPRSTVLKNKAPDSLRSNAGRQRFSITGGVLGSACSRSSG